MAEPIEMPFGGNTFVSSRKRVSWGSRSPNEWTCAGPL